MTDDAELLRQYAATNSQAAFTELVRRYVNLVYSIALRKVEGNAHLAEEVTQNVFTDLARKASTLSAHPVLTGWLFKSAHFSGNTLMRAERRRRARETKPHLMHDLISDSKPTLDWTEIRPLIDDAVNGLAERDREAVLLRFYQGFDFETIGTKLNLTATAARLRVRRALDKLRVSLARRGVTSTAAALGMVLANHATAAAPAGFALTVAGSATAAAAATSGSMLSAGATFMSSIKLQMGITAALAIAGATAVVQQSQSNASLRLEMTVLNQSEVSLRQLQAENQRLVSASAEVARLRNDDAEFTRLSAEIEAAKIKLERATQAEAAAQLARAAAVAAQPEFSMGQIDQQPQPLQRAAPAYPAGLLQARIAGEAVMSFVIDANGDVADVKTVNATHPEFGAAATDAIKRWQFDPAQKSGLPVNVRTVIPIRFDPDQASNAADRKIERRWF
jgi:RNA polymerase sigma factor (sigma-70 family)